MPLFNEYPVAIPGIIGMIIFAAGLPFAVAERHRRISIKHEKILVATLERIVADDNWKYGCDHCDMAREALASQPNKGE